MIDPSILVGAGSHGCGDVHDGGSGKPVVELGGQTVPQARQAAEAIALARRVESRCQSLAAAIEMLSLIDDVSTDLQACSDQAARSSCDILGATRGVICWRRGDRPLRVLVDTGDQSDEVDQAQRRMLVAAAEEIAARGPMTDWPPQKPSESHALSAVAQFAKRISAAAVIGVALTDRKGRNRGVWLVIDPTDSIAANFLSAVAAPMTSKLMAIERLQPSKLESTIRDISDTVRGRRRKLLVTTLIAVLVVLLLPLRYKIRADIELQPVTHRLVAVPFDGPLEKVRVRPGDMVHEGDLLATINPREIEFELASIRADLNRAVQEKKGLMAEHDFAGSRIASLESDRLRLQSELLQYRRDNLEIRSPISGVVVSGDLKESEGMPMSRGETLMEIAPLGRMVVEILIPEEDVFHAREGMDVDFYVHAIPTRSMHGQISRIHPRAELRDHDNVYIAEVTIADPDNVLRPGMRGRASIHSDRHPLGWNLFHKAVYALRHALGW